MSSDMARHRAHNSGPFWALPALLIPLGIAGAGWSSHVAGAGHEVAPNVEFAGVPVAGMSPRTLTAHIESRRLEVLSTPITIDMGGQTAVIPAQELGFEYKTSETMDAVFNARHADDPVGEFASWVTTPFSTVEIEDRVTFDAFAARQRLSQDDLVVEHPMEPSITSANGDLKLVPGHVGTGIDIDGVVDLLSEAALGAGPIQVKAPTMDIRPVIDDEDATRVVDDLNMRTALGMLAVAGDRSARLPAELVRRHLRSSVVAATLTVSLDLSSFQAELEGVFDEPMGDFVAPTLNVVDGVVHLETPGEPPPVCCSMESIAASARDLLDGGSPFYSLEPRPDDDAMAVAWADGSLVAEVVAEFTTHHTCCESRVTNIQRIADLLRGVYLVPGETLSLNEFVGERTRDKGFVAAGAIRRGHLVDEVGGGVSQFVTTVFNAVYFAGLDLDEYQSHSIYFSRYPFGREATISIPGPDLVMTNTTDYPILIWPTYDDRSITVTIYSTPHVIVEELEQRISKRRQCTHVETDRQRTYPDGRIVVDTIEANYRPAEGIDCSGNVIPRG